MSARGFVALACLACGLPEGAAELARDAVKQLWANAAALGDYVRRRGAADSRA